MMGNNKAVFSSVFVVAALLAAGRASQAAEDLPQIGVLHGGKITVIQLQRPSPARATSTEKPSHDGDEKGASRFDVVRTFPVGAVETFAWTPDGRHVLLPRDGAILLCDLEGTIVRALCKGWTWTRKPKVSPDGHWLVFVAFRKGGMPKLWRVNLDGNKLRELIGGHEPEISPDGRSVYFEQYTQGPHLYRLDLASGEVNDVKAHDMLEFQPAHNIALSCDGRWMSFAGNGVQLLQRSGGTLVTIGNSEFREDHSQFACPPDWLLFRRRTRDMSKGPHDPRLMVFDVRDAGRSHGAVRGVASDGEQPGDSNGRSPRWIIRFPDLMQARFRPRLDRAPD